MDIFNNTSNRPTGFDWDTMSGVYDRMGVSAAIARACTNKERQSNEDHQLLVELLGSNVAWATARTLLMPELDDAEALQAMGVTKQWIM
jgi:hypothetical protein